MKILAFADTHGDLNLINKIISKSKDVDLLICAGDISLWEENLKAILKKFERAKAPLLIIPGNHEHEDTLKSLCKKSKNVICLHRASYKINNYLFFGYGTGGFTQINKDLERFANKFKKTIKDEKLIFITHSPPYKTKLDFLEFSGHAGSKSVRKIIEDLKPILHICGHLHETEYMEDKIKNTRTINPGSEGKIIEI